MDLQPGTFHHIDTFVHSTEAVRTDPSIGHCNRTDLGSAVPADNSAADNAALDCSYRTLSGSQSAGLRTRCTDRVVVEVPGGLREEDADVVEDQAVCHTGVAVAEEVAAIAGDLHSSPSPPVI